MQDTKVSPKISIDSFTLDLLHDRITSYVAVEGEEEAVIFSINQGDFEKWVDDNELRNWDNSSYTSWGGMHEEYGTFDWDDIYSGSLDLPFAFMEDLLKGYIQHLYDMEAIDFQSALNKILSSHKSAI